MIERINLLPSQQRNRAAAGSETGWFLLALALAAAALAVLGVREILMKSTLEKQRIAIVGERDRLTQEQQTATAALGRLAALTEENAVLQARLDALAALQQGRRTWSDLLVRISRLTPEGLWLTAVESGDQGGAVQTPVVLNFRGKALSHALISELLGALEHDQGFQDVVLISTAKATYLDRDVVDFSLSCQVKAL